MKNLTAILLLLAIGLAVTVDADKSKGSFNLSGSFDPGFSFGRGNRNKNHRSKTNVREEPSDDGHDDEVPDWPNPEEIHHFGVPDAFTHNPQQDVEEDGAGDRGHNRHRGNHDRGHRQG